MTVALSYANGPLPPRTREAAGYGRPGGARPSALESGDSFLALEGVVRRLRDVMLQAKSALRGLGQLCLHLTNQGIPGGTLVPEDLYAGRLIIPGAQTDGTCRRAGICEEGIWTK
jgi:hypothetical protein